MSFLRVLCGVFVVVFFMSESWARREQFVDPLDTAAEQSAFASKSNLVGIARAGQRLVAVGQAGHILYSDDSGANWKQATVPVSTDLVAVYFAGEQQGWVVGHDGVILHSADAGATWQQQLGGRQLIDIAQNYYAQRAADGDAMAALQAQAMEQLASQAPAFSFLDVWFQNEKEGYAVGAFNLIFKTLDGGTSWQPWFEHMDNPNSYHLYGIRGDASGIYIAGELGLLLRLDPLTQRFVALDSPYQGSFFGVMVAGDHVITYGLRGNAYVSEDGARTWKKLHNPSDDSLTSGVWLSNGDALLLSQGGELLRSMTTSTDLEKLETGRGFPANSVVVTERKGVLAIAGPLGVKQLQFN